jgi:hypothetical protein
MVHVAVVHVRVIHTGDLVESCICACACVCEETRRGDVVRAMYRACRTISTGLARGRGGARGAADNEQIDDYLTLLQLMTLQATTSNFTNSHSNHDQLAAPWSPTQHSKMVC